MYEHTLLVGRSKEPKHCFGCTDPMQSGAKMINPIHEDTDFRTQIQNNMNLTSCGRTQTLLWLVKFTATCHWNIVMFIFRRELEEELGIILPKDAFEMIFIFLQEWLVDQFLCSLVGYIFLCLKDFFLLFYFIYITCYYFLLLGLTAI